jgi:hypothetical protein
MDRGVVAFFASCFALQLRYSFFFAAMSFSLWFAWWEMEGMRALLLPVDIGKL